MNCGEASRLTFTVHFQIESSTTFDDQQEELVKSVFLSRYQSNQFKGARYLFFLKDDNRLETDFSKFIKIMEKVKNENGELDKKLQVRIAKEFILNSMSERGEGRRLASLTHQFRIRAEVKDEGRHAITSLQMICKSTQIMWNILTLSGSKRKPSKTHSVSIPKTYVQVVKRVNFTPNGKS